MPTWEKKHMTLVLCCDWGAWLSGATAREPSSDSSYQIKSQWSEGQMPETVPQARISGAHSQHPRAYISKTTLCVQTSVETGEMRESGQEEK